MFNSLDYVKVLESVGLPRNQAETHVRILGRVIGEDMASKEDIRRLEVKMATKDDIGRLEAKMATKDDIGKLEVKTAEDIRRLEAKMATKDDIGRLEVKVAEDIGRLEVKVAFELQNLEHRMTIKLGGLMAAFLATGLTAAKLLFI